MIASVTWFEIITHGDFQSQSKNTNNFFNFYSYVSVCLMAIPLSARLPVFTCLHERIFSYETENVTTRIPVVCDSYLIYTAYTV